MVLNPALSVAEQRIISIQEPSEPGMYRVIGTFYFNPDVLKSPYQLRILSLPGTNVTDLVLIDSEEWPDAGVMYITVGFMASDNELRENKYIAEWGDEKFKFHSQLDSSLPELKMEMLEESAQDESSLSIGTMVIKVRKHPEIYYYWYLLPIGAIIAILLYRRFRYFNK
ncbi:hypothetical protein ACFLS1_10175 [Verrucomicrobiota bacterium]